MLRKRGVDLPFPGQDRSRRWREANEEVAGAVITIVAGEPRTGIEASHPRAAAVRMHQQHRRPWLRSIR